MALRGAPTAMTTAVQRVSRRLVVVVCRGQGRTRDRLAVMTGWAWERQRMRETEGRGCQITALLMYKAPYRAQLFAIVHTYARILFLHLLCAFPTLRTEQQDEGECEIRVEGNRGRLITVK